MDRAADRVRDDPHLNKMMSQYEPACPHTDPHKYNMANMAARSAYIARTQVCSNRLEQQKAIITTIRRTHGPSRELDSANLEYRSTYADLLVPQDNATAFDDRIHTHAMSHPTPAPPRKCG